MNSRRSFFCVGDVKQAIYGWRGGKAEIFEVLADELPGVREESLNKSYRSAPAIIETVNRIFTGLSNHGNLEQYRDAVERWCGRFSPHTTNREGLPGYACLVTAPRASDGKKQPETTLSFAADRIAELVKEAPGHSIGVLVRKNKIVAKLIFELRRRGIAASEEGGSPLTDSAAVQLLLSLLRLADHPGDTAAAFHVAKSPLGPLVSLTDDRDAAAVDALAERIRSELSTDGYGPTLERLSRLLVPNCNSRDLRRLQQLVELAFDFQPNATLRPGNFVRHVENESVADPTDADVRVMNYHQVKGLEFDIVVLPELDGNLIGQLPSFVTGQPGPTQPIDHVCRYRNQNIQNLLPADLRDLFRRSADQNMTEALCLVYVAVTRAVHALHMIVAPSSASESKLKRTPAGLLRAALTDGQPANPETTLYETGDRNWFEQVAGTLREPIADGTRRVPATDEDLSAAQPVAVRLAPMPDGRARGLQRAAPSGREGGTRIKLANVLRLGNAAAMDRGTLIHAWFEQIRWLDEDGLPPDDKLRQVAEELEAATHLDVERILGEFHVMLRSPKIARALTRKSYCPPRDLQLPADVIANMETASLRLEVQNESRFAVRDGGTVISGSIDRLVLISDDRKLLAADIIDFKTDAVPADDPHAISEKVEYYRGQLETYRPAVAAMYRIPIEAVSARLLMLEAGVVETV